MSFTDSDIAVMTKAIETYGVIPQMVVAMEEMSELTKELCKAYRGNGNPENIAEEIADVEIMLQQLMIIFNAEGDVGRIARAKLKRLNLRMKGELKR